VSSFEEEEEEISIASNVVQGEDQATREPGFLREKRIRRYVSDFQSWLHAPMARSSANPGTVTISHCRFNKAKKTHLLLMLRLQNFAADTAGGKP